VGFADGRIGGGKRASTQAGGWGSRHDTGRIGGGGAFGLGLKSRRGQKKPNGDCQRQLAAAAWSPLRPGVSGDMERNHGGGEPLSLNLASEKKKPFNLTSR
jgi:hypothetical protein